MGIHGPDPGMRDSNFSKEQAKRHFPEGISSDPAAFTRSGRPAGGAKPENIRSSSGFRGQALRRQTRAEASVSVW